MKSLLFVLLVWISTGVMAQTLTYQHYIHQADSLTKRKEYLNAAKAYTQAFEVTKGAAETTDRYNAACVWALANNADNAFSDLDVIVGTKYFDYNHLTTDNDLAALHADKRWQQLLDKIKTSAKLRQLPLARFYQDFDLMKSALQEAHTGLYWYNTRPQFDSICNAQRAKIKPRTTTLDFYNIVAPIIAFAKEGHTYLLSSSEMQAWFRFNGKYFPFYLKFLSNKAYILNDVGDAKTHGMILTAINGRSINEIVSLFLSYEPADGYNTTSKYRWIEENAKFSVYYARCYPQTSFFDIEVTDPATGKSKVFNHIPANTYEAFAKSYAPVLAAIPNATYKLPAILNIDSDQATATLTFNTFNRRNYKAAGMDFKTFVKDAFAQIAQKKVKHLILDIRKNGGGTEGYEDYLLSFMIEKDYLKYKYVQASAFHYSFYPYTDYKNDWQELDKMLADEHYLEKDGRILRKPGIEEHEKPQAHPFKGDIYVLVSGLTYSGGSEFASLVKNYTNAVFIGEEVGGGYYGNTSGNRIVLTLPNSGLQIGIPILKFVVETPKETIPFGHGVMPDHEVQPTIDQYLSGYDAEMAYAQSLIAGKH